MEGYLQILHLTVCIVIKAFPTQRDMSAIPIYVNVSISKVKGEHFPFDRRRLKFQRSFDPCSCAHTITQFGIPISQCRDGIYQTYFGVSAFQLTERDGMAGASRMQSHPRQAVVATTEGDTVFNQEIKSTIHFIYYGFFQVTD